MWSAQSGIEPRTVMTAGDGERVRQHTGPTWPPRQRGCLKELRLIYSSPTGNWFLVSAWFVVFSFWNMNDMSCLQDSLNSITLFHISHQISWCATTFSLPCDRYLVISLNKTASFYMFPALQGCCKITLLFLHAEDVFRWPDQSCPLLSKGWNVIGEFRSPVTAAP